MKIITDTPPTAAELREMAYRVLDMPEDYIVQVKDIAPLARYIEALVRADDHEPVTVEWLISVGLWEEPEDYYDEVVGFSLRFKLIGEEVITIKGTRKASREKLTRGDVRNICRLIGRTLNEASS